MTYHTFRIDCVIFSFQLHKMHKLKSYHKKKNYSLILGRSGRVYMGKMEIGAVSSADEGEGGVGGRQRGRDEKEGVVRMQREGGGCKGRSQG